MFPVSDLQSAMTGVAFVEKIGVAVAWKVSAGAITSSPSLRPIAKKAACKADVPEFVDNAYLVFLYFLKFFSNT